MFNTAEFTRPTYKANREYVKNKNGQTTQDRAVDKIGIPDARFIEDALKNEDNNIEATDKEAKVNEQYLKICEFLGNPFYHYHSGIYNSNFSASNSD